MEIIDALQRSAHLYEQPDTLYGYGIPDMLKAYEILSGVKPPFLQLEELPLLVPNPFENTIFLVLASDSVTEVAIEVFDMLGRKVLVQHRSVEAGLNKIAIDRIEILEKGYYVVTIRNGDRLFSRKVVK
ncbi:MAG: T9SS type A sorting domain-containing protein, partial [Bacteroidetes bacterium]|nr:T9SS type A sorting domain-containing protein [Bacteroidota bacterium]